MAEIVFREEADHEAFTALYRSAGLDIGDDWTEINHPVYSVTARRDGALLGAATVSRRFARLVLDYVAVEPEARGYGLGKRLTSLCRDYAAKEGAKELWLAAREPGFYRRLGAVETEDTALLRDCLRCPDYQKGCDPKELLFHLT